MDPGWGAGRGQNALRVYLVDQNFVPSEFLREFQEVIRYLVSCGPDVRPKAAPRYEVKERFTGLIMDGPGQHLLLVKHLKPVLRQLIANQMFGLAPYQKLTASDV